MAKWPWKCAAVVIGASFLLVTNAIFSLQPDPYPHSPQLRRCENLPLNNFVHPIHYIGETTETPTSAYPKPGFSPSILVNPSDFCLYNHTYNVIFVIHSDANHAEQRNFVRERILTKWYLKRMNAKAVFVVGLIGEKLADQETMEEASVHRDVLVTGVRENYHNITYKAQAWVRYLAEKCEGRVRFVLKMDDDVHFDDLGVNFLLRRYRQQKRFIACRVFPSGVVVRNPLSKWFFYHTFTVIVAGRYLSKEEYSGENLGVYCQGMAYLFTGDLLREMERNIDMVQFLWMDDWYVTHALLSGTNAIFLDVGSHYVSTNSKIELSEYLQKRAAYKAMPRAIFAHFRPAKSYPLEERLRIWDRIQSYQKCVADNVTMRR